MPTRALGSRMKIGSNAIAGLKTIGAIESTTETIDVTTLDSADGYREFIAGFSDTSELAVSGNFEPGDTNGQYAMYSAHLAKSVTAFSILYPAAMGASWDFNGIVTKFSVGEADVEGVIPFEASIKITGKPILTVTPSADLTALTLVGTGGTLSPSYASGTYAYTFGGVTAASVTITATLAGATLKLYANGVYLQDLTSGSASSAIAMSIGSKKLTIIANEVGKTQKLYEIVVVKTA